MIEKKKVNRGLKLCASQLIKQLCKKKKLQESILNQITYNVFSKADKKIFKKKNQNDFRICLPQRPEVLKTRKKSIF